MVQGMVTDQIIERINRSNYFQLIMPLITVSMYPGRSQEQKDEYAKAITKSAVEILKTKENHVIVVFEDNPKENWFLAGNQL
jgi:4-oxalocrotonate tautomerase